MNRILLDGFLPCVLCAMSACGGGSGGNYGGGGGGGGGAQSFMATGSMQFPRKGHTATLLNDGRVLIAGGENSTGALATAEIFDGNTGVFTLTGSMETGRVGHTATLLSDGKVLVAGGGTAEVFDPMNDTFRPTGNLVTGRVGHTATLLKDGTVLLAGGGTPTAEIFDPKMGQFTSTGNLAASRSYHAASLLSSGGVLIAGGTDSGTALGDLYNPATGMFGPTATGGTTFLHLAATLLNDGRVFLAGGQATVVLAACGFSGGPASFALAVLFDSSTASFSAAGDMTTSRAGLTVTLLNGGDVLIAGGATITSQCTARKVVTTVQPLATAEIYNPVSGTFSPTASMTTPRDQHTATLLANGKVLVVGGADVNGNALASAELFQ